MAKTIQIKIPTESLTIEVNDRGDTIILPVSDERFTQKLVSFAKKIEVESAKLSEAPESEDIMSMVNRDIDLHQLLKDEFNNLFGTGSYEKVFGEDVLVGAEYVMEFLYQCMPYIEAHTKKRADKFNKYSANRVGSSL